MVIEEQRVLLDGSNACRSLESAARRKALVAFCKKEMLEEKRSKKGAYRSLNKDACYGLVLGEVCLPLRNGARRWRKVSIADIPNTS
jgi:hypothetical protein